MSYSVAIRTLGANKSQLKELIQDLFDQTVKPDKILIFIAENYPIPNFRVENEAYICVKKGMMKQRLLPYEDVSSEFLLMLDDDVKMQPDSVEKLLEAMVKHNADLVGADTFQNHRLPIRAKIWATITNLVFPHFSQKWAFKIHLNGSFSYLNDPRDSFYWSQSCAGNVMLWKKTSYDALKMQDELWLDGFPFAYGDDMLETCKVYKNGMKLGVVFNSGIKHLDCKSASVLYHNSSDKIKTRTMAQLAVWWRTCFRPGGSGFFTQFFTACAFLVKISWLFCGFLTLSLVKFDFSYISYFVNGLFEGWKFVHSKAFTSLPPYVIR